MEILILDFLFLQYVFFKPPLQVRNWAMTRDGWAPMRSQLWQTIKASSLDVYLCICGDPSHIGLFHQSTLFCSALLTTEKKGGVFVSLIKTNNDGNSQTIICNVFLMFKGALASNASKNNAAGWSYNIILDTRPLLLMLNLLYQRLAMSLLASFDQILFYFSCRCKIHKSFKDQLLFIDSPSI